MVDDVHRTCARCGDKFELKRKNQHYCSRQCQQRGGGPTCYVCGLETARGGKYKRSVDGKAKHHACFEHGTEYAYDNHGCRCGVCVEAKSAAWHDWVARNPERVAENNTRRRAKHAREVPTEFCIACGKPMDLVIPGRKRPPLHKRCEGSVPNWKREGRSEPGWFTEFRKRIERNARGVKRRRRFINGRCPWCGESGTWLKSRFCSPTCRQQDRYARKGTFSVSPVKRQALYERDRSICHLCGRKVDLSLKWPDPMSPTLDHLVPQVQGGTHEDTNLRLAHFHCNSSRSDLSVTDGRKRVKSRLRGDPEPVFLW